MGRRGIVTVARDALFGGWTQKQDEPGTVRNEVGVIAIPTRGPNDSVITASNYEKQIAANKGPVHASLNLTAKSVGAATLRIYKPKRADSASKLYQTRVRTVPEPLRTEMLSKAAPGSVLALAEDVEEIVGGHRLVDLLQTVNADFDIYQLQNTTAAYLGLIGNAHWYTPKDSMGIPTTIIQAPSEFIKTQVDKQGHITGYVYKHGRNTKTFEKDEIIHFRAPAPGEAFMYYGRGDLMGAIDDFNLLQRMYTFEFAMFDNGGMPAYFLSTQGQMGEDQRRALEQQVKQRYGGADKAGKWMVGENVKVEQLSMSPRDMNYQGGRKISSERIYNSLGAPVAMMTNQINSRAALDASMLQIAIFQVDPMVKLIQQALNAQLIPAYKDPIYVEYDSVIPQDKEFELKEDIDLVAGSIKAINEVRVKRGMEPVEGGEIPYIDFSKIPLGTEVERSTQAQIEDMVDMAFVKAKSRIRGNG